MADTTLLRGTPLAEEITEQVRDDVDQLRDRGVVPTLGTVLMSDDEAAQAFMDRKHERCRAVGVATEHFDLSPAQSASVLSEAVEALANDPGVSALFVQVPLPDHVDHTAVRERIPTAKDVDCFAFENLGLLVSDDPRVVPATPAAVFRLLRAHDVETVGADVCIVGRTTEICRPLANVLLQRGPAGDATVTVCHSHTTDLGAKTRAADVLVTAAGTPGLVDASMVAPGATVIDSSVNRVPADTAKGYELVGDVDFAGVRTRARAITPVPGGVGPLTLAMLLRNVVTLTARQAGVPSVLPDE